MNETASSGEPFRRFRMQLAYDGGPYRGFADQGDAVPTVARALRDALARMMKSEPVITVAGRTDAGVHAWGQVVSFDAPIAFAERFSPERILKSLNKQLPSSILIRAVAHAEPEFSARFSATGRSYRYTVRTGTRPSPFTGHLEWHVGEPLDLEAMNTAAGVLIGEHDFTSFCRRPERVDGTVASLVRRVTHAEWMVLDDERMRFDVSANAFCHQQVRSMVAMLVAVGRGRRAATAMATALEARDRSAAVTPAPPQGLCLWDVRYDGSNRPILHARENQVE